MSTAIATIGMVAQSGGDTYNVTDASIGTLILEVSTGVYELVVEEA